MGDVRIRKIIGLEIVVFNIAIIINIFDLKKSFYGSVSRVM